MELPKAERLEEYTKNSEFVKYYSKLQAVIDYKNKMYDRQKQEFHLLDKQKIVIEVKRLRREMDTIQTLKANSEVCAIIEGREEFPELDLVFDVKQISQLYRMKDNYIRPIYISLGGAEIRCSLKSILFHGVHKFYQKVELSRYIVGRPNRITLPIDIKWKMGKSFVTYIDKMPKWNHKNIKVISYNDIYPRIIMLDSEHLVKNLRFRFGDLQNILPAGVFIDSSYASLDETIVYFLKVADDPKTDNYFFLEDEEVGKYMRKKEKLEKEKTNFAENYAQMSEEEREELETTEYDHDKLFKKKTVQKNYKRKSHISLKKQVKQMSPEDKEEFLKKAWSAGKLKEKKKKEDGGDHEG